MDPPEEAAFREFVVSRMDALRRIAYLLCRNWHDADDLVSVAAGKLYRHWGRAVRATNLDAYVRRILIRAWLDERRRRWRRREVLTGSPPERAAPGTDPFAGTALLDELAALTPRRRAAVVLRFYCDLSVEETAAILGCSTGTVRSLTSRGLRILRDRMTSAGPSTP